MILINKDSTVHEIGIERCRFLQSGARSLTESTKSFLIKRKLKQEFWSNSHIARNDCEHTMTI